MVHSGRPSDASDEALVVRVSEGDAAAFQELSVRYGAKLFHFATRLLRDRAEAEDVVQETFLRLWQRAGDYVPRSRVTTWLHRIVHNLAVDRLRVRGRLESMDDEAPSRLSAPQLHELEAKRRAAEVHAAIDRLPARQAAALTLVHWHGLSGTEAAEVMGISEEALESLLSRARRSLKAELIQRFADSLGDFR